MSDPAVPQNLPTILAQLFGGGVVAAGIIKAFTIWATKANINLAADQANASMRDEMRRDLTETRAMKTQIENELRAAREKEAAYLTRIGMLEVRIAALESQLAELRGFHEGRV